MGGGKACTKVRKIGTQSLYSWIIEEKLTMWCRLWLFALYNLQHRKPRLYWEYWPETGGSLLRTWIRGNLRFVSAHSCASHGFSLWLQFLFLVMFAITFDASFLPLNEKICCRVFWHVCVVIWTTISSLFPAGQLDLRNQKISVMKVADQVSCKHAQTFQIPSFSLVLNLTSHHVI